MSLLRAERRRLFKRRFTKYMLLVGVLVLAAVAVGMFLTHHKSDAATRADAQRRADADYQQQLVYFERFKADCVRAKEAGGEQAKQFPEDCEMMQPPTKAEAANLEWYMPPSFDFRKDYEPMILVFTSIMAMVAFVIGASFVGAEWSSGGMMNLLLWRPRRLQVFFTKMATLLGGVLAVIVVLGAIWTATFWAIALARGTTTDMTPGAWQSLALTGARGAGLVLVMGALGFAVASLGRHTAMALGGAIGVIVVFQFGLGIVLSMIQVAFPERFLVPMYVYAWMAKRVELQDYRSCDFTGGECVPKTMELTWHHSGLLFGITALVLISLAAWAIRRRDIT